MSVRKIAVKVAKELFPQDFYNGVDCMKEPGREGQPCRICAEKHQNWNARIDQVQKAIEKAL